MSKILNLKAILNKSNGQINLSLPKKQLPEDFLKNFNKIKSINVKLEKWF
jgi:hypothetical protein